MHAQVPWYLWQKSRLKPTLLGAFGACEIMGFPGMPHTRHPPGNKQMAKDVGVDHYRPILTAPRRPSSKLDGLVVAPMGFGAKLGRMYVGIPWHSKHGGRKAL